MGGTKGSESDTRGLLRRTSLVVTPRVTPEEERRKGQALGLLLRMALAREVLVNCTAPVRDGACNGDYERD